MGRRPLFKAVAPRLTQAEQLRMVQQARRTLVEHKGMSPALKARGVAALDNAQARLKRQTAGQ